MKYEDTITIPTPEGIDVHYALAGYGSRFVAELIDLLVRLAVLGALLGLIAVIGGGTWAIVLFSIATFAAWFVYDIAFEVWGGGRTLGKRWNGLRVVRTGGRPVGLGASATRTLLRLLDQWLTLSVVGLIAIQVTRHNQRLGDLAAGTIVVRERHVPVAAPAGVESFPLPAAFDATAVTPEELANVREFLARRDAFTDEARARVAQSLADALEPRVGGLTPGSLGPERLLEAIAAAKERAAGERSDTLAKP